MRALQSGSDPTAHDIAEGLSADIATHLARFSYVRVIARGGSDPGSGPAAFSIEGDVRVSGKTVRVLVFTKGGPAAEAAKAAGAEYVGYEDMIKKCQEGWADFDVAIATPEAMGEVRKLGKVLGPRGLMPNPKTGTVTDDTGRAVKEVKAGRVEFKIDKAGNVHVPVGKTSFTANAIEENARAVIDAVHKAKPHSVKGTYIHSCTISATMSPPVRVDLKEFAA